jgi:sortase A
MRHSGKSRLGRALLVVGVALLAWWLWSTVDGMLYQSKLGRRLDAIARESPAREPFQVARMTRAEADSTGLIGRLEIPRLGLSSIVVEGTGHRALRRGIGHVENTAFPGEPGNVGLAGHRDSYFRPLESIALGDRIRIATPDGVFDYEVESTVFVNPDRGDLLAATEEPRLTLVTCYPFSWVGPAPRRLVIRARPMSLEASAPATGTATPAVLVTPR